MSDTPVYPLPPVTPAAPAPAPAPVPPAAMFKHYIDALQTHAHGKFFFLFISFMVGVSSLGPGPVVTEIFAFENGPRALLSIAFMALSFMGVVDIIINDVMPEKFVFASALKWRYMIYIGLTMCYTLAAYQAFSANHLLWVVIYCGSAIAALTGGLFDTLRRYWT